MERNEDLAMSELVAENDEWKISADFFRQHVAAFRRRGNQPIGEIPNSFCALPLSQQTFSNEQQNHYSPLINFARQAIENADLDVLRSCIGEPIFSSQREFHQQRRRLFSEMLTARHKAYFYSQIEYLFYCYETKSFCDGLLVTNYQKVVESINASRSNNTETSIRNLAKARAIYRSFNHLFSSNLQSYMVNMQWHHDSLSGVAREVVALRDDFYSSMQIYDDLHRKNLEPFLQQHLDAIWQTSPGNALGSVASQNVPGNFYNHNAESRWIFSFLDTFSYIERANIFAAHHKICDKRDKALMMCLNR